MDLTGKTYLVSGKEDVHTKDGILRKEELSLRKGVIKTHLGKKFFVLPPKVLDFIKKARIGPQRISLKDCGLIAAYSGVSPGSKIVDAGTGSGILAMFLANLVAPETLYTYEIREDFFQLAKKNFQKAGLKNIKIKKKDIYEGIEEKNLDLITLDLPEPWRVVKHAKKSLKEGGYLVSYSPSIEQSKKFFDSLGKEFYSQTLECLVREWDMKVLRPYSRILAHTGFITLARWLGKK